MLLSDTPDVLVRLIPPVAAVLLLMVPPEPAVVPMPVTMSPPLPPVVLSTMPEFALAVVELMLRKVSPLAPIVVLATFSAGPLGAVVAPIVFVPVIVSVAVLPPLFVDVNVELAPSNVTPPEKVNEPAVLPFRNTPVLLVVALIAPLNVTAPPLRVWMSMARAAFVWVMVAPTDSGTLPPLTITVAAVVFVKLELVTLIAPVPVAVTFVSDSAFVPPVTLTPSITLGRVVARPDAVIAGDAPEKVTFLIAVLLASVTVPVSVGAVPAAIDSVVAPTVSRTAPPAPCSVEFASIARAPVVFPVPVCT